MKNVDASILRESCYFREEYLRRLQQIHAQAKEEITKRLQSFKEILHDSAENIFAELCFCICTPQSKAETCHSAIQTLKDRGVLMHGRSSEVRKALRGVRFPNVKAKRIVKARTLFQGTRAEQTLQRLRDDEDTSQLRDWLVATVEGLGMKEASHFLRNIGRGNGLAILDRHILRALVSSDVNCRLPKHLTKAAYLGLERILGKLAEEAAIPLDELDLVLWLKETGRIFK